MTTRTASSRQEQIQKKLAANLLHYRKLRQLTRDSLAFEAGTSRELIWRVETAKGFCGLYRLIRIAEVLEVSLDQLLADPQTS